MRSALFLRCMRQNINWMNTLRSLTSPPAAGSTERPRFVPAPQPSTEALSRLAVPRDTHEKDLSNGHRIPSS